VLREGESARNLSGREAKTSANRLHLLAVVRGLEALPPGAAARVYTPSDYVAQGAERWLKLWARNGWRTKAGEPVKHSDLWQAILEAQGQHRLEWHCLKNEAARPDESQQADALARAAAR
jgi:ribonuclease HI